MKSVWYPKQVCQNLKGEDLQFSGLIFARQVFGSLI